MSYKHLLVFAAVIACVFAGEADVRNLVDDDFEAGVAEVSFHTIFWVYISNFHKFSLKISSHAFEVT